MLCKLYIVLLSGKFALNDIAIIIFFRKAEISDYHKLIIVTGCIVYEIYCTSVDSYAAYPLAVERKRIEHTFKHPGQLILARKRKTAADVVQTRVTHRVGDSAVQN